MTGLRVTIQTEKMLWLTSFSFSSSVVVAKVCFELKQVLHVLVCIQPQEYELDEDEWVSVKHRGVLLL